MTLMGWRDFPCLAFKECPRMNCQERLSLTKMPFFGFGILSGRNRVIFALSRNHGFVVKGISRGISWFEVNHLLVQ